MTKRNAAHFQAIRKELAEELGYDPDNLSTLESMRVDVVFGLKSSLDEMRARMFGGEKIDAGEMRSIADTLERFLPRHAQPDPTPAVFQRDPYKVLEEIADRWRAADEADRAEKGLSPRLHDEEVQQRRIDELEIEVARLRGEDRKALPSPEVEKTITPSIGDVVPPSEQSDRAANGAYAPDLKGPRPGMTIDGKVIPPQPVSGDESKRRMAAVNADRATPHRIMTAPSRVTGEPQPSSPLTTYGDSGFFFGGDKGRSW